MELLEQVPLELFPLEQVLLKLLEQVSLKMVPLEPHDQGSHKDGSSESTGAGSPKSGSSEAT